MKFVIDACLNQQWVDVFTEADLHAIHWCSVGPMNSEDITILEWARANDHIIFTRDLDFSELLYITRYTSPSVLQFRYNSSLPSTMGPVVIEAAKRFAEKFAEGYLVTIDKNGTRARLLPI